MSNVREKIVELIHSRQWLWKESVTGDGWRLEGGWQGKNGLWPVKVEYDEPGNSLFVYSRLDFSVPAQARTNVREFLTRMNRLLPTGVFLLQAELGMVEFIAGMDFPDGEISEAWAEDLVLWQGRILDGIMPYFSRIVEEDISPAVVVEWIVFGKEEGL